MPFLAGERSCIGRGFAEKEYMYAHINTYTPFTTDGHSMYTACTGVCTQYSTHTYRCMDQFATHTPRINIMYTSFPSPSLCARALSLSKVSVLLSLSLSLGNYGAARVEEAAQHGESPCGPMCVSHTSL